MNATRILMKQQRQPMIKFLGKRSPPAKIDHTPHPHPASPSHELPESFASYRQKALQHGPLGGRQQSSSPSTSSSSSSSAPPTQSTFVYGTGRSGASLGAIQPAKGQYFDREELPARFRRTRFSQTELDAVDSGGASLF